MDESTENVTETDESTEAERATPEGSAEGAPPEESANEAPEESEESAPEESAEPDAGDEESDEDEERNELDELKIAFGGLGSDLEATIRALKPPVIVRDMRMVDPKVYNRNFRGFRPDKIGRARMVKVLTKEIVERENTKVMQLVSLLWNHAQNKLYKAIRAHVRTIDPDVEKIEQIEDDQAKAFVDDLLEKGYDRARIHICVRLNGVRFTPEFVAEHLAPPSS